MRCYVIVKDYEKVDVWQLGTMCEDTYTFYRQNE